MRNGIKWILTILILGTVLFLVIKKVGGISRDVLLDTSDSVPTEEDYIEGLKDQMSEIPGMTKYDKYEMGLDPENDDTDGDGLTDNQELNIYHSDPLKQSTAGDLYSDKYKVDNDMDVNKAYEYEGEIKFAYNKCPEVTFNPTKYEDLFAVAEDVPFEDSDVILKKYRIYNYSDTVSIDLTSLLKSTKTDIENIGVYTYTLGGDTKKAKYKTEDNTITLKSKFDEKNMYYIYITNEEKETKNGEIVSTIADMNRGIATDVKTVTPKAYAIGSPLLTMFSLSFLHSDTPEFKLYYVDSGVESVNEETINKMLDGIACVSGVRRTDINDNIQRICLTEEQYDKKINKLFALDVLDILYICNGDGVINASVLNSIFGFFTYENVARYVYQLGVGSSNPESLPTIVEYTGDFNQELEVLPFKNFATNISKDGSCMGIALLTAKVHNKKSADETGSYYIDDAHGKLAWDLTTAEENTTFFNPGLYDYKSPNFVKERRNSAGYVEATNDAEQQFINMIACLWKEGNDISKKNCVYRLAGKTNYYIGMFNEVKKRLDNGDVLVCGMGTENGAHAVNIYKYTEEEDGTINFSVYDSNYPGVEGILKIIPKTSTYGFTDSFEYEYVTDAYTISSINSDKYFIIVMDDDMRIIAR